MDAVPALTNLKFCEYPLMEKKYFDVALEEVRVTELLKLLVLYVINLHCRHRVFNGIDLSSIHLFSHASNVTIVNCLSSLNGDMSFFTIYTD